MVFISNAVDLWVNKAVIGIVVNNTYGGWESRERSFWHVVWQAEASRDSSDNAILIQLG